MRRLKWIIALPIAALLLVTAGTWTYIHVLSGDAPARLTLEGQVDNNVPGTTATTGTAAPASFDGTWIATTPSQAGYRVKEVLFGQSTEAVGHTNGTTAARRTPGLWRFAYSPPRPRCSSRRRPGVREARGWRRCRRP